MQKKLFILFLASIAGLLVISSCKKASSDPLVGKWKIVDAKGSMASLNMGMIYVFEENGEMQIQGSFSNKAKYKKEGKTITLMFPNNVEMKAEIEFNADKKLIYKVLTSDQVFTMEKQ